MRRQHDHRIITTPARLIGLAALLALPGCAAVPAINMASQLLMQNQRGQTGMPAGVMSSAAMPSAGVLTALAKQMGITFTGQPAADQSPGTPATSNAAATKATTTTGGATSTIADNTIPPASPGTPPIVK